MSDALPVELTQHHPLPLAQLPAGWERVWLTDIASNVSPGFASGKHSSDGKGVPHLRSNGRGDQLVIVNVEIPTRLTNEQRRLFEQLAKSLGSDVRPQERSFLDWLKETLGG